MPNDIPLTALTTRPEHEGGSMSEAKTGSPDDQFADFGNLGKSNPDEGNQGDQRQQDSSQRKEGQPPPEQKVVEQKSSKPSEFDPSKFDGQKRRWWDSEIKPHWDSVSQRAAKAAELEAAIAEREARLKELEPFKSRVAELEPLTTELDGLKKKLSTYDETLVKGFTPDYNPASDSDIQQMEADFANLRKTEIGKLIRSDLIVPDDPTSLKEAAADARRMDAQLDDVLKWAHGVKKNTVEDILAAQTHLKKVGFNDPAAVWNAAQNLLNSRLNIGKKMAERKNSHVDSVTKDWDGRRSTITSMVQSRFTTPVEQLDKKLADGVELTDDEIWTAAARLLPEDERVKLMADAITDAQEIFAGAKPLSREELTKNPQLLNQLMVRERDVRSKLPSTLLQGTTAKLQSKIMRNLLEENRKLKARAGEREAALGIPRDAGGATQSIASGGEGDKMVTMTEAEEAKEKAFGGI
jgi:hypothetical protein